MKGAITVLAVLVTPLAVAAPFADPFRPPHQIEQPAADDAKGPAALHLESVLIAPDRRLAVIDGRQYREGERFGDGRVLRISESEVVIRHPDRDEKLALFPDGGRRTGAFVKGGR
jgi:MSHA biogenesis protein MshK